MHSADYGSSRKAECTMLRTGIHHEETHKSGKEKGGGGVFVSQFLQLHTWENGRKVCQLQMLAKPHGRVPTDDGLPPKGMIKRSAQFLLTGL